MKWGLESYIRSTPSDSIYPVSSALDISQYVEQYKYRSHLLDTDFDIPEENCVQYALWKDEEKGGNLYRDVKIGSNIVAHRINYTEFSFGSSMVDVTEQITTETEEKKTIESIRKYDDEMRCKRRKSC